MDSFSVAFVCDQAFLGDNFYSNLIMLNDRKNAYLLKWTTKNYGYPWLQQIVAFGNEEVFMPVGNLLLHLSDYEDFIYVNETLLEYVKSGDWTPEDYAGMIDRNNLNNNLAPTYTVYQGHDDIRDSVKVDAARKSIGLPGFIHLRQFTKDFFKKNK